MQDVFNFVFSFAESASLLNCSLYSGMDYSNSAVEWARKIRDLMAEYYVAEIEPIKFSGTVEIDESLFGRKNKYHRGKTVGSKIWIFGLVERDSNRIKLLPVDKRDQDTLVNKIILKHVDPGSTIYSDGWRAYKCLSSLGFAHYVVEHKHAYKTTYKNTETGDLFEVHTNRIEGAWKHAKDHFRKINGTKINNFEGHLVEIMFRNWSKEHVTTAILNLIKQCYNLETKYEGFQRKPLFETWFHSAKPTKNDSISRRDSSSDEEAEDSLNCDDNSDLEGGAYFCFSPVKLNKCHLFSVNQQVTGLKQKVEYTHNQFVS